MAGTVIWCVIVLGCAILFYGIGQYAGNKKTPMHFWSGTEVKAEEISDVPAYNRENAGMWKTYSYSLWYWGAGVIWFISPYLAIAVLLLGGTLGIALLISCYRRIEKKYRIA